MMTGQGIGGTIAEIKDNSLTITTREGKTATAKLTADTKFMKNRQHKTSAEAAHPNPRQIEQHLLT